MPYQPTRDDLLHRYRVTVVLLIGFLLIGYALRELGLLLSRELAQDTLAPSLVLSAGLLWLVCGLARCNSLKAERQRVAEILESL